MNDCMRTMAERIRKGNIERTGVNQDLALYMGSGDFGGCFDSLGLQSRAFRSGKKGDTVLMHADVYHRGAFGLDYHIPIGRITYQDLVPEDALEAKQHQNIWDGILQTDVTLRNGDAFCVTAAFHPYARDLLGIRFEKKAGGVLPKILYRTDSVLHIHYQQTIYAKLELMKAQKDQLIMNFSAGNAKGLIEIQACGASGAFEDGAAVLTPDEGQNCVELLICAHGEQTRIGAFKEFADLSQYFQSAKEGWHKRWGNQIPDLDGKVWNALFLRGVYHMLCSWSPSDNTICPPNGWSGNGWPFEFPQDAAFIHPVFLKLGMYDIAKAKVEFYYRYMDEMHEYTKRIYGTQGIMWAWIFPIGPNSRILPDGAPNMFHYEIHNSVYPAKMAYDTALAIQDSEWARKIAWPIIRESARFYASVLNKEDGKWGIQVTPSMGQDEFGGANAKNYLCALYSARYTLTIAADMKEKFSLEECDAECARWKNILNDGLAFNRLENSQFGVYQTCEAPNFQLGNMKHPIELLPYTTLAWKEKNQWEINAYQKRYQLCADGERNIFHGWTLAWILLSEGLEGDEEAFTQTIQRMPDAAYTDDQFIQIYETSKTYHSAYYVTSEGVIALAVLRLIERKMNV